ncbi:MAG: DNA repair protein RecN [Deltaproteobacteria bacterium]|nr:DNA repair protein RecN [Deltaproteobacteria bacterium]
MLQQLRIRNIAVIDQAELELGLGLNVLTGETGAGKTMVLAALNLILGGRASSDLIREGETEATVEALFGDLPAPTRGALEAAGCGDDDELVLKRVVNRGGRGRIYLNGSLASRSLLSEIAPGLIHIYGQHEQHTLLRTETHLALLDAHGGLEHKAAAMRERFTAFADAWRRVCDLREKLADAAREEAFLRAQADEIEDARLEPGEEDALLDRRRLIVHSEKLYQTCKEGESLLYEDDNAVVGALGRFLPRLRDMAEIDGTLSEAVTLLEGSVAQLDEAAAAIRQYADRLHFDPRELERLEDRLAEINRLRRKYRASVEEILALAERAREELTAIDRGEESLAALTREFEAARDAAWKLAEELSRLRRRAAKTLQRRMEQETAQIGLPNTTFEVRFRARADTRDQPPFVMGDRRIGPDGVDDIEFFFSPNPGHEVRPLARIASGGELSRLMLALKSVVLSGSEIPTLLFDEVDAGIGGGVAEMVGRKLATVAQSRQVICVTHLAPIAALARSHYVVEKTVDRGRTFTTVRKLEEAERVRELARMLAGVEVTAQAERHAAEMLKVDQPGRT